MHVEGGAGILQQRATVSPGSGGGRTPDLCGLDTGYTTITDSYGQPHSVYVSVTRDGSVWVRVGRDHASLDWIYEDESRVRFQGVILDSDAINLLQVSATWTFAATQLFHGFVLPAID